MGQQGFDWYLKANIEIETEKLEREKTKAEVKQNLRGDYIYLNQQVEKREFLLNGMKELYGRQKKWLTSNSRVGGKNEVLVW